jgi:DNA polymerase-3 subunit epsilon
LIDHKKSGRFYHQYINPEREVWPGAQQVHGLTLEQLQYKPKFAEIAPALLNFISGAELITHSAAFHCGFLNKELEEAGLKALINYCPTIIDTLKLAEKQHPDQQNSLTALGVRYQLDHLHRNLKGALADVDLNAEIYLAMSKDQAI